jgi:hypothetical protein
MGLSILSLVYPLARRLIASRVRRRNGLAAV